MYAADTITAMATFRANSVWLELGYTPLISEFVQEDDPGSKIIDGRAAPGT